MRSESRAFNMGARKEAENTEDAEDAVKRYSRRLGVICQCRWMIGFFSAFSVSFRVFTASQTYSVIQECGETLSGR